MTSSDKKFKEHRNVIKRAWDRILKTPPNTNDHTEENAVEEPPTEDNKNG